MSVYLVHASEVAALAGLHNFRKQEDAIETFLQREDPYILEYHCQYQSDEGLRSVEKLLSEPKVRRVVEEVEKLKPKNVEELAAKKRKIDDKMSTVGQLTPKERDDVSGILQGGANKSYGTEMEQCVRERMQQELDCVIRQPRGTVRKRFFKIGDDFYFDIIGRADGIVQEKDEQYILEVKNRTKRLFGRVRDYDAIQVQAYCYLYDCKFGYLVEALKTKGLMKTRQDMVKRDEQYWTIIKENVKAALEPYFLELNEKSFNRDG